MHLLWTDAVGYDTAVYFRYLCCLRERVFFDRAEARRDTLDGSEVRGRGDLRHRLERYRRVHFQQVDPRCIFVEGLLMPLERKHPICLVDLADKTPDAKDSTPFLFLILRKRMPTTH